MALNVGELFGTLTIKGTSQAVRSLDEVQASFTQTGAAAGRAGGLIDESSAALTGAGKAANLASAGSARFRQAQLQLFAATEKYTALLDDENASLAQLARAEATVIGAQERLNKAMASGAVDTKAAGAAATETEGRFASMRASMASTVEMAGKLGLALGAFELVKKAIDITKEASAYQRQMLLIQTQTHGSADEVKTMSSALLGLSGKVAQSPLALAQSLYHLESIGVRGSDALTALTVAAKGATIGNADLEDTTNALTFTIQSGITGVNNLGQAMAVYNTIVGAGDMSMQQLVESLGSHGLLANAKASGVSIQELGAALAVLGDNGLRGAPAATALIQIFNDLLKPAQGGAAALDEIGLSASKLRNDLSMHGLNSALQDLSAHLNASGYSGKKLKGELADIFTKKASANLTILLGNMDLWNTKLAATTRNSNNFGQLWTETTKTASFQFNALGDAAQATGMRMANALLPVAGAAAGGLLTVLTGVTHALGAMWPVIKVVGAAWAGMFAVKLGRAAFQGAIDGAQLLAASMKNAATETGVSLGLMARDSGSTAAVMQADLARMGAAGAAQGAEMDQAAADAAAVQATVAAAIGSASEEEIAAYRATAAAAQEMADASAAAAAEAAAAADSAAAEIDAAAETASIGWAGLAGPIGAAALGIVAIISLFHKSSGASKEATDAAKAFTEAFSSGPADKNTIADTIVQQLSKNNVPGLVDQLNKALGQTRFSGSQFVSAIAASGKPLSDLESQLRKVINAGTTLNYDTLDAYNGPALTPAAQAATKLLKTVQDVAAGLNSATKKEIASFQSVHVAATSIDEVGSKMGLAGKTAESYAAMLGLVGDKNSVVAVSSSSVKSAIETVSQAYKTATATGTNFLSALNTFSTSAGTAADRAQLIGSTLVAANGDALNFAAQMNAASGAAKQLGDDIASAAKSVGKSGETTKAYIDSIVNLKKGTIDYHKSAAAPLINDMQSMQTAAMNAAEAVYQHARATETGTQAADKAYKAYKAQTSGQLVDELTKLTGNAAAAKKLANQYFGMPSKVKTLIEQEGANPVVTVLNKIGRLLADLVGKPWNVSVKSNASQVIEQINGIRYAIDRIPSSKNVLIRTVGGGDTASARASGGIITGAGTGTSDSIPARLSNGEFVVNAAQTSKHRQLLEAINRGVSGFASGGFVGRGKNHPLFTHEGPQFYEAAFKHNYPFARKAPEKWDWPYQTGLTNADERAFERWVNKNRVPFDMGARVVDYDMRGYWKATRGRGWHEGSHFPDTYKTPYDTTFSNESKYALPDCPFAWHGNKLIDERNGQVVFAAAGGLIAGPGSGTSDSIPARLSNGEFVVNAAATSQHLGLLQAINAGVKGFAGGGEVGGHSSPSGPFNIGSLAGSVVKGIESAMAHLLPPVLGRLGLLIAHGLAAVSVSTAIAKSVRPASANPSVLAGQLNTATAGATNKTASESTALVYYQSTKKAAADLQKTLDRLKASDAADAQAARNHASALSTEAANIHGTTKADEARKKALEDEARAASNAATKLEQANKRHETALGKVVTAANNTAAKAKTAYGKIKTAADNATQAAEQDAQNLISAIDQQFSDLQTQISDFVSSISGDLTAGSDLATVWGNLGDAVSTASDNLTTAQQALSDAQAAVVQATPDTASYTQAIQAQSDALAQVNAAHQVLVQAQQSGNQAGIMAAQRAQTAATDAYTTAVANAASAQQDLGSAAAPTADQLQAVTDAQTALTQAQDDYNSAVAADTTTGLQAKFNSLLANTQKFASDLTTLQQQAGNSQAAQSFVSQIAGMGVDAGDALAQQLLAAGPTGVSALVSTMGTIQDVADQSGAQLAQGFYGQGVTALQQLIAGLKAEFPDLVTALQPYLLQLQSMFTIVPTVSTPVTGTLTGAGTSPAATTFTTTKTHALSVVAAKHGTTVEKLLLANPSLNGDTASTVIKAGTKFTVPAFANGVKNFAGGAAWVGERGPELVTLPSGASVIPNDQVRSGGVTATLHPDDRALLQAVADRPVQLLIDHHGKTVIGEVANDHRQSKRLAGNRGYR